MSDQDIMKNPFFQQEMEDLIPLLYESGFDTAPASLVRIWNKHHDIARERHQLPIEVLGHTILDLEDLVKCTESDDLAYVLGEPENREKYQNLGFTRPGLVL